MSAGQAMDRMHSTVVGTQTAHWYNVTRAAVRLKILITINRAIKIFNRD